MPKSITRTPLIRAYVSEKAMYRAKEAELREAKRWEFMEALESYVDARIQYAAADPEWRRTPTVESTRLEAALNNVLGDV